MSTKIYTGFKVKTKSFSKILELVEQFRPKVIKVANEKLDNFKGTFDEWQARVDKIKKTNLRDLAVDTDFELVLFPTKNNYIIGIVYSENYELINEWMKSPLVENYSYWNNTDPPEKFSDKEWVKREKDWNAVLIEKSCVTAMHGFSIKVNDPSGPYPKAWRG